MSVFWTIIVVILVWLGVFAFIAALVHWMGKSQRDLIEHIKKNNEIVSAENGIITTSDGSRYRITAMRGEK